MGEAVYYLKARYKSPRAAARAVPLVAAMVEEGFDAQEYWQAQRSGSDPQTFWKGFAKRFPRVSDYLRTLKLYGKDHNNALAGYLDFAESRDDVERVWADGEILTYHAQVWHFADWGGFAEWVRTKTAAVKVAWLSDEDMNPFDALEV